jgi:hypothetical protein
MGLFDFYTDNFYQYLVPLGPWNPNNILRPGLGYYFLDSPHGRGPKKMKIKKLKNNLHF